jgi:hypothetical protein
VIISNHSQMDAIVSKSKNLEWDGWDVVAYTQDDAGFFDTNGVLKNGQWCVKYTYKIYENGWNIPDRIIKNANW